MSVKLNDAPTGLNPFNRVFQTTHVLLVITLLTNNTLLTNPVSAQDNSLQFTGEASSWSYGELRVLDPPDAPSPGQDIIAAYLRFYQGSTGFMRLFNFWDKFPSDEIQVRLDFLDLEIRRDADVYLAIDYTSGGSLTLPGGEQAQIPWDTLILLPAFGSIQAWDEQRRAVPNLSIHVIRDPILDTLVLTLDASRLRGRTLGFSLQVFTTEPGSENIADQSDPFRLSDPPPQAAPVLFVFWNTFPAYTPAPALRRWDGAHTGPFGGRHGLYNLLRLARSHQIPLALLDLKSPVSLSALDYVEGLPLVQRMAAENLLILPDHVPQIGSLHKISPEFVAMAAQTSRQVSLDFHLPASQFVYASLDGSLSGNYPVVMTNLPASGLDENPIQGMGKLLRWREKTVIAIPEELPSGQVTLDGLSLNTRKALVLTAIANAKKPALGGAYLLFLGGDLPDSEWGAPQYARLGFRYMHLHPWIRPTYAHDLIGARPDKRLAEGQINALPPSSTLPGNSDMFLSQFIDQLVELPQNTLTQVAWQTLLSLYGPLAPHPPELDKLRAIYAGQLGVLLEAARWAADPGAASSCAMDLDLDGQSECLLTSGNVFAVINSGNGALTHVFIRTPSGFHQVIAPSYQFVTGLSEASSWNLEDGFSADPSVIPGAFSMATEGTGLVQVRLDGDQLILTGDGIEIAYRITSNGLITEFRADHPVSTNLPVALDPWKRFTPSWGERYIGTETSAVWTWGLESGPSLEIRTNAKITPSRFNETRKMMAQTENPNFEFPPSHFLPFPLASLALEAPGDFFVEISLVD